MSDGVAKDPQGLLHKAEKALAGASGGFSFFGGREEKYQNAAELFIQAANSFKIQGANVEAGKAFEQAAQIQNRHLNEPDDAANSMVDAFKVYKKVEPESAVRCLNSAIERLCAKGNFRRAASQKESLGELFESELHDRQRALEAYETAAAWYDNDNAPALANKLWLKVADIAALEGDYYKAIEKLEKTAQASISNNLMKYSVKEWLLKAGICHLATKDPIAGPRALEQYAVWDPTFTSQREYKLLEELNAAVEAQDAQVFTDQLYIYDQTSRLDNWKIEILNRIKHGMEEASNEFA